MISANGSKLFFLARREKLIEAASQKEGKTSAFILDAIDEKLGMARKGERP